MKSSLLLTTALLCVAAVAACSEAKPRSTFAGGVGGSGAQGMGAATGQGAVGGIGVGGGVGGLGVGGGNPGTGGAGAAGGGTGMPVNIDECQLDAGTVSALEGGGPIATRFLYPYDQTVFPRGLAAPVLQWDDPGGTQSGLLKITSQLFTYRGCFTPTAPGQFLIPQHVWDTALAQASGPADPLVVELTTMGGGGVSGPIGMRWVVAPATLKGAVYYNTYNSPQAGNNGAVMRVLPGGGAQTYLFEPGVAPFGPCVSCHSLSANGSRMLAMRHQYPILGGVSAPTGQSYVVGNPPQMTVGNIESSFAALTPDGSRYISNGAPFPPGLSTTFPRAAGNVLATAGPSVSSLHDAVNGASLPAPGWDGVIQFALMPQFSPDGTKIVFNHHEAGNGKVLAIMDYDQNSNGFSNYRVLWDANGKIPNDWYPAWPFFTPDSQHVVFGVSNTNEYVSEIPNDLGIPFIFHLGDLYIVEVASGASTRLDQAGARINTVFPGRDEGREFYPTVSPVAAGGYYWLFFTSRRQFGNTQIVTPEDAAGKNIWVSALTIGGAGGTDISHPAFFLPGQELESGNHRAFASLEPCKADGAQCSTGVDCCCGGCQSGVCGCPMGCSQIDERCETSADCCDPGAQCIGGFCAFVIPR